MTHNDIGEKIRRLRTRRGMTQAELAGDLITRNMLSRVENGAALPSLPTVWYLAERLGVPAGFLLAEGSDDSIWRKMGRIADIRRALAAGEARICLDLCRAGGQDELDDEIYLIMAKCALMLAGEAFHEGRLYDCRRALDEALDFAAKTMYDTSAVRSLITLYFHFMRRLSPLLYSEVLPGGENVLMLGAEDAFGRYVLALDALEAGETRRVEAYLAEEDTVGGWQAAFAAHWMVTRGEYAAAKNALLALLRAESGAGQVLLYEIFCDLEVCCRELGDFKGAYEYARDKVALLERMLGGER